MPYLRRKEEYLKWAQKARDKGPTPQPGRHVLPRLFPVAAAIWKKSTLMIPILAICAILTYSFLPGKGNSRATVKHSPTPKAEVQKPVIELSKIQKAAVKIPSPPAVKDAPESNQVRPKKGPGDSLEMSAKAVVLIKGPQGEGCGIFLSPNGLIVTNTHIIGKRDEAEVFLPSGGKKKAAVVKKFGLPLDLAFLQMEGTDFFALPTPDSEQCQEGEEIAVLGFPVGGVKSEPNVSRGKIRACNQLYQGVSYLQTEGAINKDNDGGPIFNSKGEVIGLSKGEFVMKGLEGSRLGLAIGVIKASRDEKLIHLEDKIKDREKFFKYVYDDLWMILSDEYPMYQKRLYELHVKGVLSAPEAYRLEKKPLSPPPGYSSLKAWVADLTERVVQGELSKGQAAAVLRDHYKL